MSVPLGHRIDGEFVCMACIGPADHRPAGINGRGSALDQRTGSGRECARCQRRMPYLATVRLLPDGYASIHAPDGWRPTEKVIRLEREESTLVDKDALVYISLEGGGPEVGVRVSRTGHVEVWVHDDPFGDGSEPSARWEHSRTPLSEGASRERP